uniref:Scm like with four mbt domains 2 n=1 Tax=Lepisosteus oculatus TaxID=7918 RepID=W5NF79_LEPOC|nr:PREDICTED: scm-like with four MBT domains protein 2 isoform X1 [Lepisosteus oculatus]XP_015207926.1 PREDICTED: scm-like with four MBT domains protein 2 isoform X1 [Lepisosteus oculatus]XP_015207927.1 PREDICTED: scm-like with four MBT domains protein 2 isoform X1 [Lepisosteus oculatus]
MSFAANMQKITVPIQEKAQGSTGGNGQQIESDGDSLGEDIDFNWEEYLEETGASAAPHTAFKHVEISLQSSFQPGMKLEVANKSNPDTYWVATIITTCGQLLLLRFSGYGDDRKADFWVDVMTANLHPVGWCTQNNKVLMPPEDNCYLRKAIKEKYSDWTEFLIQELTGSRTAPANLLEGPLRGKNTVDLIMVDSLIELQDCQDPFQYWMVRVIENIGGRLRLRYIGLDCDTHDVWLFYLDFRLRPVGWCQENRFSMEPPKEIQGLKAAPEWKEDLDRACTEAAKSPLPLEVFKDHADLCAHSFKAGMKLEMVDPEEPFHIRPVTVTKVYNDIYFQVTVDNLGAEAALSALVCHAESPGILPVQWCLKNGVNLTHPKGYLNQDFDWADYLKQCGTEAAPDLCFRNTSVSRGFTKNMKLEAVNPMKPSEICVASITKVKGRLMWLHVEGLKKPLPEYIVDVESMDIFPVGWCEANGYQLTPPHRPVCQKQKKIAVVQPEKQQLTSESLENLPHNLCPSATLDAGATNGKYCCSQIFVNHRCFSGPYLNKGRIAELPQSVGPGKCTLVLKEVLGMLINAAYKPGRVLRELQLVEDPQWNFQEETLKAKYKGKTYRSTIKIVRTSDQVSDFCRKVCLKLQCCPNLFSPALVTDKCPENCSVHTKTKYTYYYGKKKKVIKPAIGENLPDSGLAKPARRRKKRKSIFVQKKRRSSTVDYTPAGSPQDSEEDEDPEGAEDDTGSEATSSEPRDDHTDASSVEVVSSRPRRAVTLRRNTDSGGSASTERSRRKRTTRSGSYTEDVKYHPAKRTATKVETFEDEDRLVLDSNPLEWTVADVVRFIKSTDCAPLAKIFQEQDIDGQALLLLTLPTVQECMELKLGPAIKLCHQIERVKFAFYAQYAN